MEKQPLTKLLCVDDDADVLTIAKYCLENLSGVKVKCVGSGKEAIQEAISFHPDLILLDVMMPEMDGIETVKAIRLDPMIAQIPVIFFTAKTQKYDIDSYLKLGIIDVITKPFDPFTFSKSIQQIWDKYQQSRSPN